MNTKTENKQIYQRMDQTVTWLIQIEHEQIPALFKHFLNDFNVVLKHLINENTQK